MIEATNLAKVFDTFRAVDGVNLHVEPGELLALLGPNGAGKSTTVRMLGAILRPSSGAASINGFDVVKEATEVRRCIGMLTEQPGLYPRMNGLEYLTFYGRLYGLGDGEIRRRADTLFDRFGMPGVSHKRLGVYSKGMRQKVGLMRAMLHNPPVLLLDEPTSAMDPYSARLVRDAIQLLRQDRRTIILCTHNLTEAEELADRVAMISQGKIVCCGTVVELKRQILGEPVFELRVDKDLRHEKEGIKALVDLKEASENTIRYRTPAPETVNPQIVRYVSTLGAGVVSLREVPQSLEEVYLTALGSDSVGSTAGVGQ